MRKVAMFSMGTRGDIQPYIYLARALNQAGFEATIGSHPCWRKLVEDADVNFVPVGPDIDIEKETTIIRGKHSNQVISLLNTMNFIFKIILNSSDDIYNVCKKMDLIIVSHSQMGAAEAKALGLPTINVTLQAEMIPKKGEPQTFIQKQMWKIVCRQINKPYNKIRKKYNVPLLQPGDDVIDSPLDLIPVSAYVKERNPYWEAKHVMTGYWYEEDFNFVPPKDLSDFLAKGERPIILALGAMSFEAKEQKDKLDMFVKAFQKTGMRAIIQGFQETLKNYDLPDTMIACGNVPHCWLFRQGFCVIHHCGFGTSMASMIFGIPSITVPHVLDQSGFALELKKAGIAGEAIPAKDLSTDRITQAILSMQDTYEKKVKSAKELSEKLRNENGLQRAVTLIKEAIID